MNLRIELGTSHTEGRKLTNCANHPSSGLRTEGLTPQLVTANRNTSMNPDLKLNFQFTSKRSKFTVVAFYCLQGLLDGGRFLLKYIFTQKLKKRPQLHKIV